MKFKYWTNIVREVFPSAQILDAALEYPITNHGWKVNVPSPAFCDWQNPNYRLVINLQDMLTSSPDGKYPVELMKLHQYYNQYDEVDMSKIIVLVWPLGIKKDWPKDSFNIIEFSSHQYETWCSYKNAEDVLREAFGWEHREYEYNFVCPNRIYKPHRAALVGQLNKKIGNISLQTKGQELKYPSLSVEEYDNTYDNLANLLAMRKNYNTALFTIVSESQYSEEYGIISEKTFNAIVAGHPFLVCAHRLALEHIHHYGFFTYNRIFDETYDELDNVVRTKDMLNSNAQLVHEKLPAIQMQRLGEELKDIVDFNRNYFFEQFGNQMVDELRMDLLDLWGK